MVQLPKLKTFSEMEPGEKAVTASKVISTQDLDDYCRATGTVAPLHTDEQYARSLGWKTRLVPGLLTSSCAIGLIEQSGLLDDGIAYLEAKEIRFKAAVYANDTLKVETELLSKRLTKAGDRGLVTYVWKVINQDGEVAVQGQNTCMVKADPNSHRH